MNTLDHSYVHARVIVYTQTRSFPSLSFSGFSVQSLDHVRVRRLLSFQSRLPIRLRFVYDEAGSTESGRKNDR